MGALLLPPSCSYPLQHTKLLLLQSSWIQLSSPNVQHGLQPLLHVLHTRGGRRSCGHGGPHGVKVTSCPLFLLTPPQKLHLLLVPVLPPPPASSSSSPPAPLLGPRSTLRPGREGQGAGSRSCSCSLPRLRRSHPCGRPLPPPLLPGRGLVSPPSLPPLLVRPDHGPRLDLLPLPGPLLLLFVLPACLEAEVEQGTARQPGQQNIVSRWKVGIAR